MNQTISANIAKCIQSTHSIGGNTYYDICANTTRWVPWGSADWLNGAAVALLVAFMAAVLIGVVCLAWRMRKDF